MILQVAMFPVLNLSKFITITDHYELNTNYIFEIYVQSSSDMSSYLLTELLITQV